MKYLFLLPLALLALTACTSEEERINTEIEQASYCSQDSDCILLQSECPFDCYQAVNKAEAERIDALISGFESSCVYSCVAVEGVACLEGKCTVVLEDPSS